MSARVLPFVRPSDDDDLAQQLEREEDAARERALQWLADDRLFDLAREREAAGWVGEEEDDWWNA